jgi:ABC-type nitrate/sulfonate/bicarbonate transport system substrate-binding protein
MRREIGHRALRRLGVATTTGAIVALALFGGSAASAPGRASATEVRVVTLPIANGFPLDLGIKKGFFAQQGIEVKKTTLQSGNDVVLALANNNGDIGYLGFVPMYIAVSSGIPLTLVGASVVEGILAGEIWFILFL